MPREEKSMAENNTWSDIMPKPAPVSGPPRWILSFVDLTGVLVAFFVLLFSMRSPDLGRWQQLQNAMHKAFTSRPIVLDGQQEPGGRMNAITPPAYVKSDGALYLQQLLQRRLQNDPLWGMVEGRVSGNGFNLPLPPSLFTENGTGIALTPAGDAAISRLAEVIRNWSNPMSISVSGQNWANAAPALAMMQALRAAGVGTVTSIQFNGDDTGTTLSLRVKESE
jgi:flagellar motor protein MotB